MAEGVSLPLAQYLEKAIEYFHQTGKDPRKKDQDTTLILQELRQLKTYFEAEKAPSISENGSSPGQILMDTLDGFSKKLFDEPICCPSCQYPFSPKTFAYQPPNLVCNNCGFELKVRFGNTYLQNLDILVLLYGGTTRDIPGIGVLKLDGSHKLVSA